MQPNKSVEETIESIMTSEPMKRVLGIESTAIISGRATQYEGKLLQDVLREALTSHTNTVLQGVVERVEGNRKEVDNSIYCGCDGECFTACGRSYNKALDDTLSYIREQKEIINKK